MLVNLMMKELNHKKLYSCNARIYDEGDNVYLYSYNTLVEMYSKSDNILYRFGRFFKYNISTHEEI